MKGTITFYIARHGETMLNKLDKVQGWCDSPLTQNGIDAAKQLGAGLREIKLDAVYTSDLRRTRQTAENILAEQGQVNLEIKELPGLREACFGSYESDFNYRMWTDAALYLHYTSMEAMYRAVFEGKVSNEEILDAIHVLDKSGTAENFAQIEERTQNALKEIVSQESREGKNVNILVVAHGMCITAMLKNWGGDKLLKSPLLNASVCKVICKDTVFSTEIMGDMSYVENGKVVLSKND